MCSGLVCEVGNLLEEMVTRITEEVIILPACFSVLQWSKSWTGTGSEETAGCN